MLKDHLLNDMDFGFIPACQQLCATKPLDPIWVNKSTSSLQFNLRRAAKERIRRMVAPHSRRKDLETPDYVKKEWENGNRDDMAELLMRLNFNKDWSPHNSFFTVAPCPYIC